MGTETPNRGLYKPDRNEINYDALVNASFDELDDPVPHYDNVADAPTVDGFVAYITGDGATTPEGLYLRRAGAYEWVADPANIDHDSLQNFVANEHVDHSSVTVTGTGSLTGGGDLTASRTLDVSDGGIGTTELADSGVTIPKLSFNPTTQAELDTHTGTTDAHHTKTTSSEIDHDATTNFVATEHVDHSSVTVTGTGSLTGGGTIDANQTLDVAAGGIDTAELAAEAVTESILDAVDAPGDGEILSYNSTAGRFEWVADQTDSGGAPADASYLTTQAEAGLSAETVVDAYPFTTADLAFDTATQAELDTHTGTADAHHAPTGQLLTDAGYASGDDLWLMSFGEGATGNITTTSTTYSADFNFHQDAIQWDVLFPSGATTRCHAIVETSAGSGETVDIRLQNTTDGETIAESLDVGGGLNLLGPVSYTPTTTASPIRIQAELRTSPGSNSSQAINIDGAYGVQL